MIKTQKQKNSRNIPPVIDFSIYDDFISKPDKLARIISIIVIKHIPELVSSVITMQRAKGLTYEAIGKLFNINRSQVFQVESLLWFPKKEPKRQELLKKCLNLL